VFRIAFESFLKKHASIQSNFGGRKNIERDIDF